MSFRQTHTCEECPSRGVGESDLSPEAAWIAHLTRLDNLLSLGCRFAPDDLPPEEWDGLALLARERLARAARRPPDGGRPDLQG